MKRLKMAIAALLAFALLPLIGSTALADESSASSRAEQIRAAANIEAIADASTMGDWSGVVENTTQNIGRIWTDKTVSTNDIDISGAMSATVSKGDSDFITALSALSSTSNIVVDVDHAARHRACARRIGIHGRRHDRRKTHRRAEECRKRVY